MGLHIRNTDLPGDDGSRTFLGRDHGGVPVSFFVQASPPGHGPGPHTHPYAEVFVLHEGSGSFLAGDRTIEATGGSVVVVPPGELHGFTASGAGRLRMTLHPRERPDDHGVGGPGLSGRGVDPVGRCSWCRCGAAPGRPGRRTPPCVQ